MVRLFAVVGSVQAIAVLFTLGRAKIIALMVGPEGAGVIGIVDQIVQSLSYASALSLPFASLRYLSRAHSSGPADFQRCFSAFFKGLLAVSVVASIVAATGIGLWPELLGPDLIRYRSYVLVALFSLPLMMLGGLFNNTLAAAERPNTAALFVALTAAAYMISAYVGLSLAGILGFYLANLIFGLMLLFGTSIYLRRQLGIELIHSKSGVLQEIRNSPDIISFAVFLFAASVTQSLSLLAARYSALRELGEAGAGILHAQLAIALAIGGLLSQVNGLFLTPKVNRNIPDAEKILIADEYLGTLIWIATVAVICAATFPDLILTLLFSREFAVGASLLVLFVASQGIIQVAGVFQALMIGFDDLRAFAIVTVTSHAVFAVVAVMLMPRLGLLAAAIGYGASAVVLTALTAGRLATTHGYKCSTNVLKMTSYAIIAGIAGWEASQLLPAFSLWELLLRSTILLLLVGGSTLFLSPKSRKELIDAIRPRPIGRPT